MNILSHLHRIARTSLRSILLAGLGLTPLAQPVHAQVSYTGTAYTQNFDTLASTGTTNAFVDNVTLTGWYSMSSDTGYLESQIPLPSFVLNFNGTTNTRADDYAAGTGSSNGGDLYSFGVAGANALTERALGSIGSGNATTHDFFISLAVKNDTALPLASFTVTYDGEQWRLGGNTTQRAETVFAYYRVGGTALDGTGTWTPVTGLNFTSPNVSATTASGAALDGNFGTNRVAGITATISAPVQPNEIIWILWVDLNDAGSDHGMALDNVTFTATAATAGAPIISSSTTASGTANSAFAYTITASDTPTSYNATDLPAWLAINTTTGELTGTPPVPGSFPVTITATNGTGTGSAVVTITIAPDPLAPVVTGGQSITHVINTPLTYQVQASNTPTSYTIGTLPAGLTFDTATGIISGTPTTTAVFNNVAVSATNALGTGTGSLNISLVSAPAYTGDLSVSTYVGSTFSFTATFTQAPFAYLFEGLPSGLQNLSGAVISGTAPATPGTYPVTATATNDFGSTVVNFDIIILDAGAQAAIPQNVVVNKFSNSDPDRIELLVVGNGNPGSVVDMRGMILKDFSGDIANDGGGRVTFTPNSLWSAVPAGTLIVLSNGITAVEDLVGSDFVLAVNLGNATYFAATGAIDIATVDMVLLKAAGTGTGGVAGGIHALASGATAAAQFVAFGGPKLRGTGTTAFGFGVFANNATSTLADYNGTDATGNTAVASLTFGAANNATNQTYIASLRTAPLSALETWRSTTFAGTPAAGSTASTGLGADAADYDNDGIANLVEYATGTDPKEATANPITTATTVVGPDTFLTLAFARINDPALTYTILESSTLTGGFVSTGVTYPGATTPVLYTDDVPLNTTNPRQFLRVEVTY